MSEAVTLGIVGGSGALGVIEALGINADEAFLDENVHVSPKYFIVDRYRFQQGDTTVYFVLRHGRRHDTLPAKLDQRGIFKYFKSVGVQAAVLTSATGSLDTEVKLVDEGGIVVNDSFMRGYGYHGISFGDLERPHAVMSQPYHPEMRRLLLDSIKSVDGAAGYDGGVYIQNEGNQFESPAEIADLVTRLDEPLFRLGLLTQHAVHHPPESTIHKDIELYKRLADNLNRRHAQVGMNAGRETTLAWEAGIPVAVASFPVNYGAGLVPADRVDHERTKQAISKATKPFIVPFLRKVIEVAPDYVKRIA